MDAQELRFLAAEAIEVEAEVVRGAVDPLLEVAVEEDLAGDALRRAEGGADLVEGKAALELVAEGLALLGRQFAGGRGWLFRRGRAVILGEGSAQAEDGSEGQEGGYG
jgi:hypothetical protein